MLTRRIAASACALCLAVPAAAAAKPTCVYVGHVHHAAAVVATGDTKNDLHVAAAGRPSPATPRATCPRRSRSRPRTSTVASAAAGRADDRASRATGRPTAGSSPPSLEAGLLAAVALGAAVVMTGRQHRAPRMGRVGSAPLEGRGRTRPRPSKRLRPERAQPARAVVRQRRGPVERAGVQPHARGQLEGAAQRVGEQEAAEALPVEGGQQPEVGDLDAVVVLAAARSSRRARRRPSPPRSRRRPPTPATRPRERAEMVGPLVRRARPRRRTSGSARRRAARPARPRRPPAAAARPAAARRDRRARDRSARRARSPGISCRPCRAGLLSTASGSPTTARAADRLSSPYTAGRAHGATTASSPPGSAARSTSSCPTCAASALRSP